MAKVPQLTADWSWLSGAGLVPKGCYPPVGLSPGHVSTPLSGLAMGGHWCNHQARKRWEHRVSDQGNGLPIFLDQSWHVAGTTDSHMCLGQKCHSTPTNPKLGSSTRPPWSLRDSTWLDARNSRDIRKLFPLFHPHPPPPPQVYHRAENSRPGHFVSQQTGVGDTRKWS